MKFEKHYLKVLCAAIAVLTLCSCIAACQKNKDSGQPADSSLDIVYTKSDSVKRVQSNYKYTLYGVVSQNNDGTFNLKKYSAASVDYGRTINILSNSVEDMNNLKADENTEFEIDALKEEGETKSDFEVFISQIGKKYKGKLIYFEMEIEDGYIMSAKFFKQYYR